MIISISHKGLKRYVTKNDPSKLPSDYLPKITRILQSLNSAAKVEDMNLSGYGFHQLTGDLKQFYSVKVTANYRIIFRFQNGDAYDVDFVDYH